MSNLPDLSEVIRHCDTAFLDEHFAWNADPAAIADKLRAELRAEALTEGAEAADGMPTGDCSDASDFDEAYDWGTRAVAERLREMAAEARTEAER